MKELYPTVGPQAAIRALVDQHVKTKDAALQRDVEHLTSSIELEDI